MTEVPWSNIPVPDAQSLFSYRLADIDHPFEFFWARDSRGDYAFRFKGRFPKDRAIEAPRMSGISVSCDELNGWSYLNLVLERTENAEIFLTLCKSLMGATTIISPGQDAAALDIILTRLWRWQELLKKGNSGLLSTEAQIGLFGELLILRDVFIANLDPYEAVNCWNGPLPDEQDFGYAERILEVKTTRTTRDQTFTVNSLAQLDTSSGSIILAFQTLGVFENDPPDGMSLNALVDDVRGRIGGDSSAVAELDIRLTLSGYKQNPEYDRIGFVAATRRLFDVSGEFPRIEPAELRRGILRATYTVSVDECMRFELDPDEAVQRIFKGERGARIKALGLAPDELIRLDESAELEFKSSVRWSYRDEKIEPALEAVVLKSVAAFANTRGGQLVVGVDDSGTVLGLEKDISSLMSQGDRDGYERYLYQLLTNSFGAAFCSHNLELSFPKIGSEEICIVRVRRSSELVAVEKTDRSGQKSKVFYVRTGNATRELAVEEIIAYHSEREKQMRAAGVDHA